MARRKRSEEEVPEVEAPEEIPEPTPEPDPVIVYSQNADIDRYMRRARKEII